MTALPEPLVISIDAMGGDHGPSVVAPAVARVVKEGVPKGGVHREGGSFWDGRPLRFLLHGDEAALEAAIAKLPALAGRVEIRHTERGDRRRTKSPPRPCAAARAPACGTRSRR